MALVLQSVQELFSLTLHGRRLVEKMGFSGLRHSQSHLGILDKSPPASVAQTIFYLRADTNTAPRDPASYRDDVC